MVGLLRRRQSQSVGGDGVIYEYSSGIYYDSSINIFFFLNEQGEEVECNEQGVEVTA